MKKIIKILFIIIISAIIIISFALSSYAIDGYDMYKKALLEKPIEEMILEIESKENYTKLEDVPKIYKDAVIAVEDHRFYNHKGVDLLSIFRAIITNLKNSNLIEGGSTITQQICKNVYFTQDRKIERKFAEIFMANELEKNCEKDKILELYFNTSFYGNGYYTLTEASRGYFDKEPNELSDFEATMIAGIPNAPSLYNPIHSLELAKQRQNQVLSAMVKYKYITKQEKDEILKTEIDLTRFEK